MIETYMNHKIEIKQDENPESPREWDNICIFHVAHKRYSFGDENYKDYESIKQAEKECKNNGDIVLPLYMYDHSGITISLSSFSCPWDSGQVGFVQISRQKMLDEFGKKVFSKKMKEKGRKIAEEEVKCLDQYLRGEVYGYDIDDGEETCYGFYGEVEEIIKEAKDIVDNIISFNIKKHCEKIKSWIKNKVPLYARTELSA